MNPSSGNHPGHWEQWIGPAKKHCVMVVNQVGKVIEKFAIEHWALGWKRFRERLQS
jgi:hypothetical protein